MANLLRRDLTDSALKNTLALFGLTLLFFFAPFSFSTARAQTADKTTRKVVRSTTPEYPKSLKDAHIGGLVRLSVTVLPNGDVAKVEALGGNPIFVETATKAVRTWKYIPTGSQTQEDVHIHFNPD
jgi:TonB family protein